MKNILFSSIISLLFIPSFAQGVFPYNAKQSHIIDDFTPVYRSETYYISAKFLGDEIPLHTKFAIGDSSIVTVNDSLKTKGIPIGFNFPFAGQLFDIMAINTRGYVVFGKSSDGGITIYPDSLIETENDTLFTNYNPYLISSLYPGKIFDNAEEASIGIQQEGFTGNRLTQIELSLTKRMNGTDIYWGGIIQLYETGEIRVFPSISFFPNTTNALNTYTAFITRINKTNTYFTTTTDSSWTTLKQQHSSTNKAFFNSISNVNRPKDINRFPLTNSKYNVQFRPKPSNFSCPIPFIWTPNPPRTGNDSAFFDNDYRLLLNDTIATSDNIWWHASLSDSLRFEVFLGTDTFSMAPVASNLMADSVEARFLSWASLVKLPLDSLAPNQKYFLKINTIWPNGTINTCNNYHFFTKKEEVVMRYCLNDGYGNFNYALTFASIKFNTMIFDIDSASKITPELSNFNPIPPEHTWTTTVLQGENYPLNLSVIKSAEWVFSNDTKLAAYFDFNGDGDFEDKNEFFPTISNGSKTFQEINVKIPKDAITGKTFMRIKVKGNEVYPFPGPCDNPGAFHTDFIITIDKAPACTDFDYTTIITPPACTSENNGSLTITPNGGTPPYHIQWNTGNATDSSFSLANLSPTARHRATISDASGCSIRTTMLQLYQPTPFIADTLIKDTTVQVVTYGGSPPYSLAITGDTTLQLSTTNDTFFVYLKSGNYALKVMDKEACQILFENITIKTNNIPTEPPILPLPLHFSIYPNPAQSSFSIQGIQEVAKINIYAIDGKKADSFTLLKNKTVSCSNLANGFYLVQIQEQDKSEVVKLIINNKSD